MKTERHMKPDARNHADDGRRLAEVTSPGTRVCQCRACGEIFGGVQAFDKHRGNGKCLDPASVGLTRDARSIWHGTYRHRRGIGDFSGETNHIKGQV